MATLICISIFKSMANYQEYHIIKNVSLADNKDKINNKKDLVNVRLDEQDVKILVDKLKSKNIKNYERNIKQYIKGDLYYEVMTHQNHHNATPSKEQYDIKCYTKTIEKHEIKDHMLVTHGIKSKKPIHAFSSSLDFNEIRYIKRHTFRISNRVFINFDYIVNVSGTCFRMGFVNANCDSNVDQDYIMSDVGAYLGLLKL